MNALLSKPLGLPELVSEHGAEVDLLIVLLHYLMIALFVGWSIFFVYVIWRFRQKRNPAADYQGVTSHTSTYLEIAVAAVEVLLLVGISIPVWARAVDVFPPEKDSTVIHVIGQQFAWNAIYPGTNGVFGQRDMARVTPENKFGFPDPKEDPDVVDDFAVVNDLKVPLGKPVIAHMSSLDVIHSFKVFPLRITQDAIPGMSVPIHFTPTKLGNMQINCAQLCGLGHYSMRGTLSVVTPEEYDKWMKDWIAKAAVGSKSAGGFE